MSDIDNKTPTIGGLWGALYLFIGILLPFYNHLLFHSSGKVFPGFPFPIAATWLQLSGVVLVLSILSYFRKLASEQKAFGRFFWSRVFVMWPVIFTQATNIMLMNTGLFMLDVSLHVLLRASEIVWVVLFSSLSKKERPSKKLLLACFVCLFGTLLIVLHIINEKGIKKPTIMALIVHFLTTVMSALNIVLFKVLSTKMNTQVPYKIDSVELTRLNLFCQCFVILPCILLFEPAAFPTLLHPNPKLWVMLGAGLLLTSVYKLSFVALILHTRAITVGVVAQLKIVPQVLLDVIFYKKYNFSVFILLGSLFTFTGTGWYTWIKYKMLKMLHQSQEKMKLLQ
ncbi:hypothetical protein RCL1_007205 [Eukaryota sp. TZLM3-RCL]